MADKIVLEINNVALDLTDDDYTAEYKNVDTINTSEAGTTLRAVIRTDIRSMAISYTCTADEVAKLRGYNKLSSVTAKVWDEATSAVSSWKCFFSGYKEKLLVETPDTRFYKVSFKLNDLED